MKAKNWLLTFLLLFLASALSYAASDLQLGTWKLNESKSKIGAGAPKNDTVIYEASGDNMKVTIEGTAPDGSKTRMEWTGKFDGKDYPSTGGPNEDMRSYKQVNDRTLEVVSKKDGKVVLTARVVVSTDGKTRTVMIKGTGAQGKKFTSTAVYDKE